MFAQEVAVKIFKLQGSMYNIQAIARGQRTPIKEMGEFQI